MRIIEFLLNNIFIVVIIFGALASLFGKAGSKKKPSQMPNFGGGGLPRIPSPMTDERTHREERPLQERTDVQPLYRSASEQERQQAKMSGPLAGSQEVGNAYSTSQAASRERSPQIVVAANVTKEAQGASAAPVNKSFSATAVQANDLRRAVVWAEILGPPRSKRPYRR